MTDGIRFSELLAYTEQETQHWKKFFSDNPQALEVPLDIAECKNARELLLHIFTVELFFSHAVLGLPKLDWQQLRPATLDELFGISEQAMHEFREFSAKAGPEQWGAGVNLDYRGLAPSKRKATAQALLHGIHHRAQLATALRQQGFKQDWNHDFLMSPAME
ncbi:MAG TPA: DinB family protein [Terriglobales bacterium]|nr:DinB family protein [Terriglobales bacterium]